MKIITALTPKGGPGKTTLIFALAKYLHDAGQKVLVIDYDDNMSLHNMYDRRYEFLTQENGVEVNFPTVMSLKPAKLLYKQITEAGKGYDYVLIDTAGKIDLYHRELCGYSDLVLIPARPNQASIDNAIEACTYLEETRKENDGLPIYGVAALGFARGGVEDREYLKALDGQFCFNAQTESYNKPYKLSDRRGLSPTELDKCEQLPRRDREASAKAAIQMRNLCKEITELVDTL